VACITALTNIGTELNATFTKVQTSLNGANNP